ncbi:MerR family transcriptional regulator [Actinomadura rupiterrae]|uniref:MerR family transcriptional regulator n=1 Tax=Actinomadura rupiterrae TaxID=559627 RepID=UPI0020A5A7C2|nr:MerR family transcriptional regulator [Actinomadura rupiterrae]MCP2336448.1 DNA-binding transcriptional MerR regulator [Actinomadura rupiterrae]
MEWTIQQVARGAGVSSRTLRHYDDIGLLRPSRVGENGYRYYDAPAVARLQRILLLRDLGLGLPVIADVLAREKDEETALSDHISLLEAERDRLDQRIQAVRHTLEARRSGRDPSMEMMLDGFNDSYREDVVARWGERAYEASNAWWKSKSFSQRIAWKRETDELVAAWRAVYQDGETPTSPRAQAVAARHVTWLAQIPGTPVADGDRERSIELVRCIGDLYVNHPDFHPTYGGRDGAIFVREALKAYAVTMEADLTD